jgi:Ca2+-binding EF-hand superfamily protein
LGRLDQDGDGEVTFSELLSAVHQMGMLEAIIEGTELEQAMEYFDAIDANNDGALDCHELEYLLVTFEQGQLAAKV